MKKSKFFAGMLAGVCLLSSSTVNLPAVAEKAAGQEYDSKGLDPKSSAVKPTISLSRLDLSLNEAMNSPVQKIELRVDGAAEKYAPTGFHIQWDERLTLVPQDGKIARLNSEEAGQYLKGETQLCENGIFLTTAASGNFGMDGVLWDFFLQLPEDVSAGDKFDIEIAYRSQDLVSDLFNNRYQNEEGMLMQSWVFTHGIEHGYIMISDEVPSVIETTTSATTATETTSSLTTTTTAATTDNTDQQTTNALGQKYDLKGLDPEQSPVKPTVSLSRIKLPISAAKENPVQNVKLSVEGAEYKYGPTGLHIQWDERLTLVPQENGEAAKLNQEEAGEYLRKEILSYTNGVFLSTSASAELGKDGVLWEILLKLPENVKIGDKYPVEIVYTAHEGTEDLFSDVFKNEEGMLMQAWVFTRGIKHGYIEITDDVVTTTSTTSTTTTTTSTTSTTTTTTTSTTTTSTTTTTKKPTTSTTTSTTTTTKKPTTTTTTSTTTTTKKPTTTTTTSTTTTTKKPTTTTTTSTTTTTKKPTTTTTTSTTTTTKKPTTTTTTSTTTTTKKPTTTTTTSTTTTTKKPTTTTTTSTTTTTKKPTTTTTTSTTTTTKKPTTTTTTSTTTTTKKPTTTTTTFTTTTTKKPTTTTTTSTTTTTKKPTTTTTTSTTTTTTSTTTTTPIITRPTPRLGDATGDGWIDSVDASRILAIYAACSTGKREPDEKEYSICDVNFDKKIDSIDASIVLAYYAYTSTKEEIPFEDYLAKRS